jgi:hypothetical protein
VDGHRRLRRHRRPVRHRLTNRNSGRPAPAHQLYRGRPRPESVAHLTGVRRIANDIQVRDDAGRWEFAPVEPPSPQAAAVLTPVDDPARGTPRPDGRQRGQAQPGWPPARQARPGWPPARAGPARMAASAGRPGPDRRRKPPRKPHPSRQPPNSLKISPERQLLLHGCGNLPKRIRRVPQPWVRAARGAAVTRYAGGSSSASDSVSTTAGGQDAGMASQTGTSGQDQLPATPLAGTPARDHGRRTSDTATPRRGVSRCAPRETREDQESKPRGRGILEADAQGELLLVPRFHLTTSGAPASSP